MHWRAKGALQKVLGGVPGGGWWVHYHLQRRFGGMSVLTGEMASKIEDWSLMAGHLAAAGIRVQGTRFMEMGTGWYPSFAICLYLGGAARVDTFDLTRHLQPDLTLALARYLGGHLQGIADLTGCGIVDVRGTHERLVRALAEGASVESATRGVVRYIAPGDAATTELPAAPVDVVFSNSVLEHVRGDVIARCFTEASRILRPRGVIFHSVNCGDHYAYVDSRVSPLNYLRYSDDAWRRWNNRFLFQNRLRAIDFVTMARDAGYAIELDTSRAQPARLAELASIAVDPRFARYSDAQLAVTSIDFIGRRS